MTRRMPPARATIDFESRSACSLEDCGSWRYSLDDSTEVLCLAFRLPYWPEGETALWHPAFPHLGIEEGCLGGWSKLQELFAWIDNGGLVEAHNAWFERGIWVNIMEARYGWMPISPLKWRCSAAKAAAHALPRNLEDVGIALRLDVRKDTEGHALMKSMCAPHKPKKQDLLDWGRKHSPCMACSGRGKLTKWTQAGDVMKGRAKCYRCHGTGFNAGAAIPPYPMYRESRPLLECLWAYCRVDVLAEENVSHRLDDLNPDETGHYVMDQIINERGFGLDMDAVRCALDLIDDECADLNVELSKITNGEVERATQRQRMTKWFAEQGLQLEDTRKETIAWWLEDGRKTRPDLSEDVWRALDLVKILGRSSTAKYITMADQVCPDGRMHGGLLYHGAATGRWSGQGVQPHNFVKSAIADMVKAWDIIKTKNKARIESDITTKKGKPIGTVMDVLAHALRGAIVPTPGHQLYVADYAAIEARVVLWLANDQDALGVFAKGKTCECGGVKCSLCDIYLYMAADIYGRHLVGKDACSKERDIGKIAVLGLGYQMGWVKFQETAKLGGAILDDEFCQRIVTAYREKFWRVKNMWWEQERAAIKAVTTGREIRCGRVLWLVENGFLFCQLPSGRRLAYCEPDIQEKGVPWSETETRPVLTFKGINSYNRQWQRQHTYGGSLVENITQAVARDLMAEAAWQAEWSGTYKPVLTVHDELIAEAKLGEGDVKQFEQLMAKCPDWASGCPVEAEGWAGLRYRK